MTTPTCEECNGACCRTFWLPLKIARAWTDAAFLVARSKDLTLVGSEQYLILPSQCPALLSNRCSIYAARPKTCVDYAVGSEACHEAIRLSNPEYFKRLRS